MSRNILLARIDADAMLVMAAMIVVHVVYYHSPSMEERHEIVWINIHTGLERMKLPRNTLRNRRSVQNDLVPPFYQGAAFFVECSVHVAEWWWWRRRSAQ